MYTVPVAVLNFKVIQGRWYLADRTLVTVELLAWLSYCRYWLAASQ